MNIGNLYLVKEFYWLVFPTRETAATISIHKSTSAEVVAAYSVAAYWSKELNCNVTYFSPGSYVVFLAEDGVHKRVLTADGKVGWIWFTEIHDDCFKEVKAITP